MGKPSLPMYPRFTVLVVEPDEPVRRSLAQTFALSDIRMITASDGLDALGRSFPGDIDALIMEVTPHGLSAVEVLQALQMQQEPPIAAWFTTRWTNAQVCESARAGGAFAVVQRPYDPAQLCRDVERELRRRRVRRQVATAAATRRKRAGAQPALCHARFSWSPPRFDPL